MKALPVYLLALTAAQTTAAVASKDDAGGTLGLYLENDLFSGTDEHYTSGFDWEILPHAGAALGTVRTFANVGGEIRAGLNLPDDFGTPSIGPAATTSTPVDGNMASDRSRFDLGVYLFARVDGRAVARNIFLDGNTFSNSHSVDSNLRWTPKSGHAVAKLSYDDGVRERGRRSWMSDQG